MTIPKLKILIAHTAAELESKFSDFANSGEWCEMDSPRYAYDSGRCLHYCYINYLPCEVDEE